MFHGRSASVRNAAPLALLLVLALVAGLSAHTQEQPPTQQYPDLKSLQAATGSQYPGANIATREAPIFDPLLGVDHSRVNIPADWLFQAGLVHGSSCSDNVSPFYRMNSPDGLSGAKKLPPLDWAWSSNSQYNPGPESDCLPYDRPIAAADFLKYMVILLNVEYVKDLPNPALHQNLGNPPAGGRGNPGGVIQTSDFAGALTRFKINNIQELEVLNVQVLCLSLTYLPPMRGVPNHHCSAYVDFSWFQEGKGTLFLPTWKVTMPWLQRKAQLTEQETARMVGQIISNGEAFRQRMNMRFQQHEEFIETMRRGAEMNRKRQEQQWNAQGQMADDWCDYALGVQKRYDPSTGKLYKTNSAYTYDWVNEDGQHTRTNDINFNPNGLGRGRWTLTRNVR
jgi:hypothetical protein